MARAVVCADCHSKFIHPHKSGALPRRCQACATQRTAALRSNRPLRVVASVPTMTQRLATEVVKLRLAVETARACLALNQTVEAKSVLDKVSR